MTLTGRLLRSFPLNALHRLWLALRHGVRVGPGSLIFPGVRFICGRGIAIGAGVDVLFDTYVVCTPQGDVRIGDGCHIDVRCVLSTMLPGGRVHVGQRVYVGPHCIIYGHKGVTIGDDTLLGPGVTVVAGHHRFDRVDVTIRAQGESGRGITIGRDVWLGAHVVVTDGVTIGDGCVVGAGAVVTRDLPPMSIAHGVPARVVGKRGEPAGEAAEPSEEGIDDGRGQLDARDQQARDEQ